MNSVKSPTDILSTTSTSFIAKQSLKYLCYLLNKAAKVVQNIINIMLEIIKLFFTYFVREIAGLMLLYSRENAFEFSNVYGKI